LVMLLQQGAPRNTTNAMLHRSSSEGAVLLLKGRPLFGRHARLPYAGGNAGGDTDAGLSCLRPGCIVLPGRPLAQQRASCPPTLMNSTSVSMVMQHQGLHSSGAPLLSATTTTIHSVTTLSGAVVLPAGTGSRGERQPSSTITLHHPGCIEQQDLLYRSLSSLPAPVGSAPLPAGLLCRTISSQSSFPIPAGSASTDAAEGDAGSRLKGRRIVAMVPNERGAPGEQGGEGLMRSSILECLLSELKRGPACTRFPEAKRRRVQA